MKKCKYIGVKEVMAQPMKAHEALQKGYKIGNSTPECNGFEVEYKDGYKSWCPAGVFIEAYKCADTFTDRLHIELSELTERLDKLSNFINSDMFKEISVGKQMLMKEQSVVMAEYCNLLKKRISLEEEQ
ncbi:hypothetical protein [Bacteroides acidifaciens]|jgi:hypothetical protein|uniref:Uncharacterized protein n=1 Tax=Bacteroides acidifaciens TaxID=85831 RepID=A0A7I9ZY67_9BACE|nr:hypothetical protein [Bacteroides acidifaciens]GFH84790.1 hypothetical protein IMSAGC001_00185 [Bacteroides acidifaciens]